MADENTRKQPDGPGGGPRGGYQKPKNTMKTVRRLLGYLTQSKLPLIVVLVCLLLSTLASVGGSYLLRPISNLVVDSSKTMSEKVSGLLALVALLAVIYALGAAATYLQARTMVRLAQGGANRLRRDLFDRLQSLPLKYFDQHTHGELMSRFTNDADNVQLALEQSVVNLLSSALLFVGIVAVMIVISPVLFLVTLAVLLAALLILKVWGGKSRRYYQKQQAALGEVNGNIQEMIEGLKVVKAFTHEEQAKERFAALNETYRRAGTSAAFYSTATAPLLAELFNINFAVTAMVGGVLAALTSFDIGGLVSYLTYCRQVGQPMNQISMQLTTILSALAGAERIFEVMDAEPELDEGRVTLVRARREADGSLAEAAPDSHQHLWAWKNAADGSLTQVRGAVELTEVDFGYVPEKQVLKRVSVYANPGQKIAFVGSTGAGKTTVTNLINRFYEIQGGRITYDGVDVRDIAKDDLRLSLGSVLQDTHLFTGTVMENIRYGRLDATDEECVAAAKTANAHSFIRRLPDGYQTMVTMDGANLSQGQRQLLAIARAAVKDPPVMILDEATSSIDTRTERLIEQGMDALMENRTVFVIAHRLSTVRNANCIVVIEGGQIIEKGSHDELLAQKGRYYQLYTGQFELD
ncbi:MAG: ABC transporter ATP-binding protein/permease [Oscillospiraceae bacterium]|nr:ABC transporter ATP-binding protein/permease [Oscillospiraceae bacterium]